MKSMEEAAEMVVRTCLNIHKGETFLIISDTETEDIGKAIFYAGIEIGAETFLLVMKPRSRHGEEPPEVVGKIWESVDVYVAPTKFSLSHTQARRKATENGARGATMPGITKEIFCEAFSVDYMEIKKFNEKLKKILMDAKSVRVVTRRGTNVTFNIEGRMVFADDGILAKSGDFGNLPAGEVFVAPREGSTNGTVVIDGSIASIGKVRSPVVVTIEDGYVTHIEGGSEAEKLREMLESVGRKEAYNVAELGIGTNPSARIVGNILEDEKAGKTVHIAFGDNSTIGGKVHAGIHLDGVILDPTIIVDDRIVLENGNWRV